MSRIVLTGLGFLVIAGFLRADEPKPVPRDEQDLIYLHPDRPYRLRLHLQVDGKSYRAHWDDVIARLFQFLDADKNGSLNAKELDHAPSEEQLRQLIQGNRELEADAPPKFTDLADQGKSGVSLAQLKGYYLRVGVAPWQVEWLARQADTSAQDDELAGKFASGNEHITRAELTASVGKLFRLDTDGDDILTTFELFPRGFQGSIGDRGMLGQNSDAPFVLLDETPKGRSLLAAQVLKRLDRDRNGSLAAGEVGFPKPLFRQLDRDGNGLLTAAELEAWPDAPADLELVIRLNGPPTEGVTLLRGNHTLESRARMTRIGAVHVALEGQSLEVLRVESTAGRMERVRRASRLQFDQFDSNNDGYLENREVFSPPFAMVALMRLADRDGDGRVSKAEFDAYIVLQEQLVSRSTYLTLVDRGRSLFDFLDEDHDQRIARRELMTAWERVTPWADKKADSIARAAIPRQLQVLVSHGRLPRLNNDPAAGASLRVESRLTGPTWFRKMDRNADGDISRMEFLGNDDQFRKLDVNADGLIDMQEAVRANVK